MCYHQPPQTESTAFHVLVIDSTFLLEHMMCVLHQNLPKKQLLVFLFLKFHFVPEHIKAMLHMLLIF